MNLLKRAIYLTVLLGTVLSAQGQPTDNPVAAQYGDGYPIWTNSIQWNAVFDATAYGAVAGGDADTNGVANFDAFEAARDAAASAGGGVVYFPAGTYYFRLPDPDGVGAGRGPNSRGLMLKDGVVIRGANIPAPQRSAIIRADSDPQSDGFLDVTYNLQPLTKFVFEFQTRGTDPSTDSVDSAGEVPMDWNFIGAVAPEGDLTTTDVVNPNNIGIVNVELEGATVFFNYHTPRSATLSTGKWLSQFKVAWPAAGADWATRAPDGTHIMESISGSAGWHTEVSAGSGRLVMNVKMVDGTPFNDMIYIGRNTANPVEGFSEYRFTGRIVAHGSDIFLANNVIAKPTRNFGHKQLTSAGVQTVLFDYANTIGIDVNKSNLGGNQDALTVSKTLGSGYFWENVVIRDNWVFNRGNKGFEASGYHMVLMNNHNERYHNHLTLPDASYVTNPLQAYGVSSGSISLGGVLFDGYTWQVSESASDYMARGYDLGGYSTYITGNSVINTGSIGNDGEGILGQRHNNVEVFGWAIVGNQNGKRNLGTGTVGENGYIGPYDMHAMGLLFMNNRSTGNVGILKEEANYQVDVSNFHNVSTGLPGGTTGSGPIEMYKEGSGGAGTDPVKEIHTDPVTAPSSVAATVIDDLAIEVAWTDAADNELGFRIERSADGGVWETVAYRPMNGATLDAIDPATTLQAWVFTPINDLNPQLWRDFMVVPGVDYQYRVVAINANDDDSTGVSVASTTVSIAGPLPSFSSLEATFDDLAAGEINSQGDWTINAADSAKATVEAGALAYSAEGTFVDGGTQHLLLNGSAEAPMNTWLTLPVDPALDGTTYVRALISSSDKGIEIHPGEFFIRLAGWNLYVAAKFYAGVIELPGSNVLEVDTTNGLPLDVTHMVVLKLNVEAGVITGVDLWLNPAYADVAAPDLSVGGLAIDLSAVSNIELRSQKVATRVDELLLATSWDEVVPEVLVPPFNRLEETFDDLTVGSINGQGDWTIDAADAAKTVVQNIGLNYTAPDGAVLDAGTKHLAMNGSAAAKMNNWLTLPVDPPLDETTYVRAIVYSSTKGTETDPGELFIRLAGWNLYVAAKFYGGVIELPGGNVLEVDTTNGLPLNTAHMVVLKLNVEAGAVTGVDLWLNPSFADSAAPDLSVAGLSVDLAAITQVEIRSQNTLTRADELLLAESWADIVPKIEIPPFEKLESSFDDLTVGQISGQGGWAIDAADADKATVEGGALVYTGPAGEVLDGGTQHLLLNGSAAAPMNNWLTLPVDPPLDGTAYMRALISSSDKGTEIDPGELFIRLAGWNLYVAAKFYAGVIELPGSNLLEVDTTNGLPLDVAHMVVLKMNVEAGVVTSVDLWLNPAYADEAAPDLSVGGLSVALSAITQLELRSQKVPTRVDELLLAKTWDEVVPVAQAVPFVLVANQFEDYMAGPVNGQMGWTAPDAVVVGESAFTYTTADGLSWAGGAQALDLPGSTGAPINDWALVGIDTDPPDETFYISYHASVSDNGTADPSELFVRNAGWGLFSALKVTDDIFEVNGTQYTEAGLLYDTPVHVLLEATVSGGVVTAVKGWLNPLKDADCGTNGDQQPPADITVDGLTLALDALTGFEVRSQKARSIVDDLVMTEKWAECFLLRQVRITAVQQFGLNVQFEGQIDDQIGEGLSPHDPADEPPSIDSIPMIDFQNMISLAFDKGLGGVADFEKANVSVTSGPEWPVADSSVSTVNQMVIALPGKDIRVTLGQNSHVEGGCGDPAPYTYTGKECTNPDFLNPAPSTEDGYGLWSIGTRSQSASGGNSIAGFNSYDFDFDPADKLDKVGLTYINWNNFQSHNGTKVWFNKPNVRVRATYTNGSEDVVLLSTGFTQETTDPYNTFFGFEAPDAGFFLKRLELFTKGNSARIWSGIDDLAVAVTEEPDLFTFTFNNEGTVDGLDRPIQAADWDGVYSSAALPLVTGDAVLADLSEGVTDDTTPGHYKAGFLFVSGKTDQPAPEGFMVWSGNTNVVDEPQLPQGGTTTVNPQTDWYSDPVNSVTNLNQLELGGLRELQMRIRPRNAAAVRFHFAIKVAGEWYVSEEAFQHSGTVDAWESVSLATPGASWLAGVVGEGSLNLDFDATSPTVVTTADIGFDALLDTVGIYIDTDDNVGQTDTWARVDSITLSAVPPAIDAPTITGQPEDVAVVEGETAVFSVTVLETEGISYQWRKGGEALAEETTATLTLENVLLADAGDYDVVVTGPGGDAISDAAALTVYAAPVVDPLLIEVGSAASSQFITVTADSAVNWTAVSQSGWITVTLGASGSGSDLVGIDVAINDSFDARSGSLLVAGETVTVEQEGMPLPPDFNTIVGGSDNGDGSWTSSWFGTYFPVDGSYVYNIEQGWLYTSMATLPHSMYLYSYILESWIWTAEGIYPVMFEFNGQRYVYLIIWEGTTYLYDYSTGAWMVL